ncbi:hypothetical protein S7711_10003 [Stachybotrys chartarum IBT 7711]|uniref:SPT23/MGA2-like DNA-binding domain-containing protein n=1 Tax=Stachybotrys chartarum (strain CBS 109288 / IBT 7711) TaxID=1280523 RepID=A0A084AQ73_STACB|nr:hypothetical protein S7711_10003 [Stachybotrys chartarum IBT 7711]
MQIPDSSETVMATDKVMIQDGEDASMQWPNGFSVFCEDLGTNEVDQSVDHIANTKFGSIEDSHSITQRFLNLQSPISSLDAFLSMHIPGLSPDVALGDTMQEVELGRAPFAGYKKQVSYSLSSSIPNDNPNAISQEVSPPCVINYESEPLSMRPLALSSTSQPQSTSRSLAMNERNTLWPDQLDLAHPASLIKNGERVPQILPLQPEPTSPNAILHLFVNQQEGSIEPVGRSRVETQIFVQMVLSPLPEGVTMLHLPCHTISKPKLLANPRPVQSPDTLELFVTLVCTSAMQQPGAKQRAMDRAATQPQNHLPELGKEENAPQNGGDVRICSGCISRERNRAGRKKKKRLEQDEVWMQGEERRVVVFNTTEMKEWQPFTPTLDKSGQPVPIVADGAMQITAPMRIACYCRHHGEKIGFNVIFTIKDWQGRVVAQAISDSITRLTTTASVDKVAPNTPGDFHTPPPNIDHAAIPRCSQPMVPLMIPGTFTPIASSSVGPSSVAPSSAISRIASPMLGEPAAKKRKASGSSEQNNFAPTRLHTSTQSASHGMSSQSSSATSSLSPSHGPMAQLEQRLRPQTFSGFSTPTGNKQQPFFTHAHTGSVDNLAVTKAFSAPTSAHPSRAPSPEGLANTKGLKPGASR